MSNDEAFWQNEKRINNFDRFLSDRIWAGFQFEIFRDAQMLIDKIGGRAFI